MLLNDTWNTFVLFEARCVCVWEGGGGGRGEGGGGKGAGQDNFLYSDMICIDLL